MMIRRIAAAAAVAVLAVATAGAASAEGAKPAYAEQAAEAGLTPTQAAYVQERIDRAPAADPTARQLSANALEIGGRVLAVGAPGQTGVTAIGLPSDVVAAACPAGYLCTYHNGVRNNYYACTTVYLSYWTGQGYIFNNQTTGTVTYLYRIDRSVYLKDVAKDVVNREVDWDPVWSIKVC